MATSGVTDNESWAMSAGELDIPGHGKIRRATLAMPISSPRLYPTSVGELEGESRIRFFVRGEHASASLPGRASSAPVMPFSLFFVCGFPFQVEYRLADLSY